ncbi:hypothetical protein ACO0LB_17875 [Undibacterium sp. SXout7W]|uniref:hypothetical protein n=1 Tax=Undibacterium sp. SXout7W TaxID=3413049 RepID=UPI003BF0716E
MITDIKKQAHINACNTGHTPTFTGSHQETSESLMASDKELSGHRVVIGKTKDGMRAFERFIARENELQCKNSSATGLLAS